jgi:hypothetical protein
MTPIACTLTPENLDANRNRWQALGTRALLAVDTTDRGLRLAFVDRPDVATELDALAKLERECCAFATWTLTVERDRILLDVAGKTDDAVPAVKEMFRRLRA